tara:strand:- start:38 stop:220 length:183 start_codon:yes stop_codon:yes gene_type:complete
MVRRESEVTAAEDAFDFQRHKSRKQCGLVEEASSQVCKGVLCSSFDKHASSSHFWLVPVL